MLREHRSVNRSTTPTECIFPSVNRCCVCRAALQGDCPVTARLIGACGRTNSLQCRS